MAGRNNTLPMIANNLVTVTACMIFLSSASAQTIVSGPATPERQHKTTHLSPKDDINQIGHRDIGHKGFGNWYSLDSEIAMGKGYSGAIEANLKLLDDPLVNEYIKKIGQTLVTHSDAKVPFTIKVVDSDELNAFSLPGGFLYINYGVIINAEDEAEVAGVMAHEIAHVAAHHAARQMTRSDLLTLISLPLDMAGGGMVGQAIHLAVGFAKPMEMLKFSRGFESEADYLGLEYLYAAGYDPQAFVSFLERAGAEEKNIDKWGGLFSTHPLMTSRIKRCQREIARLFPERDSYLVSSSQFEDIRSHLLARAGVHKAQRHDPVLRSRLPSSEPNRN